MCRRFKRIRGYDVYSNYTSNKRIGVEQVKHTDGVEYARSYTVDLPWEPWDTKLGEEKWCLL